MATSHQNRIPNDQELGNLLRRILSEAMAFKAIFKSNPNARVYGDALEGLAEMAIKVDDARLLKKQANSDGLISVIARGVRAEFVESCGGDLSKLNDTCQAMSRRLVEVLQSAGFEPVAVVGQYLGAEDAYEPNTDEWEQETIDSFDRDSGFSHWWVEVEGKLVDICADQFHPMDRASKAVVIANLGTEQASAYERQLDQPHEPEPAPERASVSQRN